MGEGVDENTGLEIYKFRRYKDKNDLLLRMISLGNVQEKHHNTLDPLEEISRCKNYAILQKPPSKSSNEKFRYAIEIYSSSAWRFLILVTLVVSYLLDTWIFTFFEPSKRPFWVITFIILLNIIFAMDVVAVASLKCFKKWRKTLNIEEPATSTVILDILLAIPYAISYFVVTDVYSYYINLSAPLAATLRIYRVIYYFYNRSSRAGSNQWTSFLIQYLTLFLISFHSWSCIWYLFSYRNFDILNTKTSWSNSAIFLPTETILDWYLVCAYWSVMCITTNALGDLYPVNLSERISATLSILVGFLLTTIVFVGSLTSQFITLSTRRSKYVSRLRKIENHLRLIQMDTTTKRQIIRYYEDLWYQKAGVFKPKMMNLLPYPLQMEICFDINATPLYSSLIFRSLPEPFLRRLSLAMTHQFYLPGDIVYNNNENKTFMVCVTKGVLELLSDEDDDSAMISFARGTCFGEISVVYNIPARCTVKAATYVECQVLDKAEYIRLIIMFPDIADIIRQEINERIERSRKMKLIHDNDTPLLLNIYASANSKKSSIKCLKDKLRYLQGKTEEDLSPEDRLDTHCLNLYILSEHVKKKIIPFTCTQNKFPWILEWDCYLTKYWEIYMLGVVFYVSLAYPYFIGFLREFPGGIFFKIDIIINISLIFNVIMSTVTAIKTKEKYIRSFVKILRYRLNTLGFYMDIMAMLPFENLVDIHKTAIYHDDYRVHMFYLCKGSKLCLVWRISHFFEKLESKLLVNIISLKVAKYCVYVTLLCYWFGVILYMESCFISRCAENSWFSKPLMWNKVPSNKTKYPFVTSVYFATTILLSIGQGDFTPGDSVDMILIAFLSLYGVLLVGYFVAEFSAVITHWSRNKTAFLEVIYTIDNFMKEHNMHRAIVSRIMAIYDLQWQYNSGVELTGNSWLKKTVIPSELRKKVLHQARFKTLTSIKLFRVKNNAFIHKLTEMAKDLILPPGEIVYYGGTISRELYIIESGYCLVTCTSGKISKEWVVGPGKDLGLLSLLYGVAAPRTIITLTHCKLISISYSSYNSALSLFPEMKEHDGLLTHEELQVLEAIEVTQNTEAYLKHYTHIINKKTPKGFEINNVSKMLFNNSFINVRHYYARNKKNYHQSFKKFGAFKTVASYLLMPIVIKPDGYFIKIWAILRVCAAFLLCLLIPVIVSMPPFTEMFQIPTIISELICYIDIYIMLHVGYYGNKNLLIYHPYLTAKKYLQGSFFVDFIASFPWYILWRLIATKTSTQALGKIFLSRHLFHTSVRMTNILQIYKLYAVFWTDSVSALKRAYIMSVLQFLLLTLFFLNLYSSILISLTCKCIVATDEETFAIRIAKMSTEKAYIKATFSPEGNIICQQGSWIDKTEFLRGKSLTPRRVYLLALYWSATSFTGAGFGDIIPQDTTHMILCICIVVHGVFFFGFVYARIASLKAVADQVMTKFQENLKQLELFMTREKVPLSLKKTVNEYWKYQWKRTGGWSHQSILGKLHTNLNEDAVLYLYEKTLQEIPLFENVEYSFFRALAKKLNEQYFQKGYMVMRANEVINKIYIIYRGKVDIVSDANEVEVCMGPGGIFGNIRGPSKYLTMSNVIASRNIDVLSIKGTDFYALMKSYPAVLRKVRYCVSKAPKDYVMPTVLHEDYLCPSTYETGDNEDENGKNDTDPTSYFESPEKSIAGSHGSKSSIGNNTHYTSATYLLLLPHRWFRKSVVPDCFWVSFIDYLILFLSYVDFVVLVYQMAFMSIDNFFYICVATDVVFIYKLFLDIHTGFMNRYGDYVLTPKKVRKMYFSKVLQRRRDFLANFLVCYIAFALNLSPEVQMGFFCYLRTPQLFRITYLFKYQIDGKINMASGNLLLKLTTIGIWASIISHVNACLFFKLSCLTHVHCNSSNWLSKKELNLQDRYAEGDYISLYVTALWYMVNLLTITGTGDVCSQNAFEYIETIILLIVIKFCTGLLISEMSAMITAHSSSRIEYDYGINKLRDGLRGMKLSDHQMNKISDYVRELWNRQQGRQMPELVYFLPFRLRCQVMQAVYGSHIRDSIIFRKTNDDFKRMLSVWLKHCVFFPGNYIVQSGSSDQCIYFIHRGEVEVLTVHANLTESVYDILGPEESFGIAQGIFVGVVHHFSFRARTVVDIVYLKLDEWKYLLDFYPKSAKIIRKKVENVYLIEY